MPAIYHNLLLLLNIFHHPGGSWVASSLEQCCLSQCFFPWGQQGLWWGGGSVGSDAPLVPHLDGRRHPWDLFPIWAPAAEPWHPTWKLLSAVGRLCLPPRLPPAASGVQSALGCLFLPAEPFVIAPPEQLLLSLMLGSLSNLGKEGALLARVFHTPAR